jgi:acyl-CoA dehydrogenase
MLTILHLVVLLAVVWYCAYKRASYGAWATFIGLILVVYSYFKEMPITLLVLCWVVYLLIAGLFGVPMLRFRFLTKPVLGFFRRTLPPMSKTEREAIDSGDVWWEGELFCGEPNWSKLLNMPKPLLTEEEQNFVNGEVETLCSMLNDWEIVEQRKDLPKEVWDYLKKQKFFGMIIPKSYGGLGFSALAHSSIITKIATRSASAAVNVMVPNSLGPAELLMHYGTEEQKNYYLPRLAVGEEIPCFALTSEHAGSDAGAIIDSGIICQGQYNGKEITGVMLNWNKRYITLAPIATVLGLAVKLKDPDHLLGQTEDIGISLFLIPTSHPGVIVGQRHLPMNMAFLNGPTSGENVFVPLDWLIGGTSMAGKGWSMLMECLSIGRAISLPALSTACGQLTYRTTGIYARIRQQFKLPIGKFDGVGAVLARIAGQNYMLNATRIMTAGAIDQKIKPAVASAISKYHMTEMMRTVISDAMDVHAGRGVQFGPRNYIGGSYGNVPIAITVEGANILTRCLIIFGQGAIRCHPYIQKEMAAAQNPNLTEGLKQFDRLLFSHIGYGVSNLFRSMWMGLSGGKLIASPQNNGLTGYYQQLTRMSTALALVSDISMLILGGELKRKESLSARLGDVLSQLYLASAVLKYFHDLHNQPDDFSYVEWCLQTNLAAIQVAFDQFFENFPIDWLGKSLRFIIFPFGRSYKGPKDKLAHKLATHMMTPSVLRDRLSSLVFLGAKDDRQDPIGRMEHAFKLVMATDPIRQRLQNAVKSGVVARELGSKEQLQQALELNLITREELDALAEVDAVCLDALAVDEFPFDAFNREKI